MKSVKKSEKDPEIPSWIFFALYYSMEPKSKWTEEKRKLAERLAVTLRIRVGELSLPEKVVDKLFEFNEFDDVRPYGISESKDKSRYQEK